VWWIKNMSKKKKIIIVIAIIVLLVLFFPIPRGTYEDGGTREYSALTYKILKWHKLVADRNSDGSVDAVYFYNKTSVFWIPDKYRSIDELWKMDLEKGGFEKVLHSKNE
jgi:hypothetical protein